MCAHTVVKWQNGCGGLSPQCSLAIIWPSLFLVLRSPPPASAIGRSPQCCSQLDLSTFLLCRALPPARYKAGYWLQLSVLCQRLVRATWRNPMLLAVNWGAALLMSLGIGVVYWHVTRDTGGIQNRFGSLFFILLYLAVMSLSSLPLWMEDRLLFIR